MGNEAAGDYTRKLLDVVRPTYIGFVGIAGAAADGVAPGTILLADRVWHYEPAKLRPDTVEFRGPTHISGRLLLDRLKHLDRSLLDQTFPSLRPWAQPVVGTIASGDKVVAEAEARDRLRSAGRNVIGFEMEGHQFAEVVERSFGSDRWFMVRSVQDAADRSKTDQHRLLACQRAAAYTVAFMLDSDLCVPVSGDAPILPEPGPNISAEQPLEPFALAVAARLGTAAPAALLEVFAAAPPPKEIRWAAIEAEAAWRAHLPERCSEAAKHFAPELAARAHSLNDEEAALLRLAAWAEWKTGAAPQARATLERCLHQIGSVLERGRWADLLGSIRRYDPADDFLAAIATYQQALSLKEAARDLLGIAISIHNIAFTYVEWLDLQHARYYFTTLATHASAHVYPGADVSLSQAHLALAWIELMNGRAADVDAARRHLKAAGELLARSRSHRFDPLSRTSKALHLALREATGSPSTLPMRPERSFWARLILAQLRASRRENISELVEFVVQSSVDSFIAPHRVESLLVFAANGYAQPEIGERRLDWSLDAAASLAWPLSDWLVRPPQDALTAIRALEGVAHLYVAVLHGLTGMERPHLDATLGSSARLISAWGKSHSDHPMSDEASRVAGILRGVLPARNALVHSTPSEDVVSAEGRVIAAVSRLSAAMPHLRSAGWISRTPPVLRVAGTDVEMSHAFSSDPTGRLTFRVDDTVIAVEHG
jgi:nucleoside phosphorylase